MVCPAGAGALEISGIHTSNRMWVQSDECRTMCTFGAVPENRRFYRTKSGASMGWRGAGGALLRRNFEISAFPLDFRAEIVYTKNRSNQCLKLYGE